MGALCLESPPWTPACVTRRRSGPVVQRCRVCWLLGWSCGLDLPVCSAGRSPSRSHAPRTVCMFIAARRVGVKRDIRETSSTLLIVACHVPNMQTQTNFHQTEANSARCSDKPPISPGCATGRSPSTAVLPLRPGARGLFFYSRDDTSGCTNREQGFSDLLDQFSSAGVHGFSDCERTISQAMTNSATIRVQRAAVCRMPMPTVLRRITACDRKIHV